MDHKLTATLVKKIQGSPPDWKPPCSTTLGSTILDSQYQVNIDERSELLKHEGVSKFGMAVTTDGATIQKSPLLNFILLCAVFPIAVFLECVDCGPHLASGGAKNAEYIATKMIESIRGLPRPRGLDLVITDGAGDMVKFRRLVVAIFPWIYTLWCVSHICNCTPRKSAKNGKIEEVA